jgi:acetyl esterase/lipase
MDPQIARRVAAIGDVVGPDQAAASREIFAPLHETPPYAGVSVVRDAQYGPHERHRLDVFRPAGARDLPVLAFVHGGGFVAGDKSTAGTPFHDNVGLWAARTGMVGVTMNYRLAPEHRWPSGAEDVGAAVAWLAANVAAHGGDPSRIVLMGSSAGATHVAGYVGMADRDPSLRGVVLLSGGYDLPLFDDTSILAPYFGADPEALVAASPLPGLVGSGLPILFAVAEHDPPVSHRQAAALFGALFERDGRVPPMAFLPGHNHFTEVLHLNAVDDVLGRQIAAFVEEHAGANSAAGAVAAGAASG